jgi:hypothetical protein
MSAGEKLFHNCYLMADVIRILAFMETATVTGPAKNLLRFCRWVPVRRHLPSSSRSLLTIGAREDRAVPEAGHHPAACGQGAFPATGGRIATRTATARCCGIGLADRAGGGNGFSWHPNQTLDNIPGQPAGASGGGNYHSRVHCVGSGSGHFQMPVSGDGLRHGARGGSGTRAVCIRPLIGPTPRII